VTSDDGFLSWLCRERAAGRRARGDMADLARWTQAQRAEVQDRMPWVRLAEDFAEHPRIVAAGPLAAMLQVSALCWCNRQLTDGFVPRGQVPRLVCWEGIGREVDGTFRPVTWQDVVLDLVTAGIWDPVDGGWQIHDYLSYQPSRSEVLATQDRKRAAGSLGGAARAARARQGASNGRTDVRPDAGAGAAQADAQAESKHGASTVLAPGQAETKQEGGSGQAPAQAKSKPVPVPVPGPGPGPGPDPGPGSLGASRPQTPGHAAPPALADGDARSVADAAYQALKAMGATNLPDRYWRDAAITAYRVLRGGTSPPPVAEVRAAIAWASDPERSRYQRGRLLNRQFGLLVADYQAAQTVLPPARASPGADGLAYRDVTAEAEELARRREEGRKDARPPDPG
jgi:hypothetical protein